MLKYGPYYDASAEKHTYFNEVAEITNTPVGPGMICDLFSNISVLLLSLGLGSEAGIYMCRC